MTPIRNRPGKNSTIFVGMVVLIGVLYLGRELLIPLALATFFCFLLAPLVGLMERIHINRTLSVLLVVAAGFGVVSGIGWLVGTQAAELVQEFPRYQNNIVKKIEGARESIGGTFGKITSAFHKINKEVNEAIKSPPTSQKTEIPVETASAGPVPPTEIAPVEEPVKVELVETQNDMWGLLGNVIGPVVHPLATVLGTIILAIFFLVNREDLRDRLIRVCGKAHIPLTTAALTDCSRRVTRFLLAQLFANCLIGTVIGLGLFFLGIPNAVLWGGLAAVARFLPYIGAVIAAFFPFAVAVALFDNWQVPLLVVGWCILVDVLSANVLEPLLYGAKTGVSPTAILLAFMFWTWIWGGIGLFLATPITVCLVVLGKHVPSFEVIYILLSDEPVLEPATRFYQRILARNTKDAIKVVRDVAVETSPIQAIDEVVLPALAKIEYDRHSGLVEDDRIKLAISTVEEYLATEKFETDSDETSPVATNPIVLAVVPDRGSFDQLIAKIIERAGKTRNLQVHSIPAQALAAETIEHLHKLEPTRIAFAAIEPKTIGRIRHIAKRIRAENWSVPFYLTLYARSPRVLRAIARLTGDCSATEMKTVSQLIMDMKGRSFEPRKTAASDKEATRTRELQTPSPALATGELV